jgi:phage tail-like protein
MIDLPLPGFRFVVTLDRADAYLPPAQAARLAEVAPGAFQQVSGFGARLEVLDYAEGGRNDFVHRLPVRHAWERIKLSKGVVRDPVLWDWYRAGLTGSLGARRDGSIVLLGPAGDRALAWEFRGGIAAAWSGPELDAMRDAVAVESLEIAHHGVATAGGTLDLGALAGAAAGAIAEALFR